MPPQALMSKIRISPSEDAPVASGRAGDDVEWGQPEKAIRYTYDEELEEWETRRVYIILSEKPFAKGGARVCYKARQLHRDGTTTLSVRMTACCTSL